MRLRLTTMRVVPLLLGTVLAIDGLITLFREHTVGGTLVLGTCFLLFGIGQQLRSRPLVVAAYVVPGAFLALGLGAVTMSREAPAGWRVVTGVLAVVLVVLLGLFVRANRRPVGPGR